MNEAGHFEIEDQGDQLWVTYKEDGSIPGLDHLWMTFKKKLRWLIVDWISVREGARGKGVGRAAIEALEQLARQLGAVRIVGRGAKKSYGFWEKMGYTVVPQAHQRPRIYKDLESSNLITGTRRLKGKRTRTIKSPPKSRPATMRGMR